MAKLLKQQNQFKDQHLYWEKLKSTQEKYSNVITNVLSFFFIQNFSCQMEDGISMELHFLAMIHFFQLRMEEEMYG